MSTPQKNKVQDIHLHFYYAKVQQHNQNVEILVREIDLLLRYFG